ncbi:MAG: hypothetical protein ACT4PW_04555 [Acidimicrobiia bacterium]
MDSHVVDRQIARIAQRQHGVFSIGQTGRAGASEGLRRRRVDTGAWLRLDSGVYALAGHPPTFLRQCWAAVLGAPGSAVGGLAAAALHGVVGFGEVRPEIVVPSTCNSRNRLARVLRFDGAATTRVGGLPTTTLAQTFFDIAPRVVVTRLERAVDDALVARRLAVTDLEERLRFYDGCRRRGLRVMRELVANRGTEGWVPPESELERTFDRILRRLSGTPRIVHQARFDWLVGGAGRVDRFLPDERIILEIDGRRWHTRVADFERDAGRSNQAAVHGLRLLRFTWVHVSCRPHEVLGTIEQARGFAQTAAAA